MSIIQQVVKGLRKNKEFTLQLTAMVDMFTIMIVFLLKSFDTSNVTIKTVDDLKMPDSVQIVEPEEALLVLVSKKGIYFEDERIATFDEEGKLTSADVSSKDEDFIKPLFKVLDDEAEKTKSISAQNSEVKFSGTIFMQADKSLDYEVLRKVMYTATMAGYGDMRLAALSAGE